MAPDVSRWRGLFRAQEYALLEQHLASLPASVTADDLPDVPAACFACPPAVCALYGRLQIAIADARCGGACAVPAPGAVSTRGSVSSPSPSPAPPVNPQPGPQVVADAPRACQPPGQAAAPPPLAGVKRPRPGNYKGGAVMAAAEAASDADLLEVARLARITDGTRKVYRAREATYIDWAATRVPDGWPPGIPPPAPYPLTAERLLAFAASVMLALKQQPQSAPEGLVYAPVAFHRELGHPPLPRHVVADAVAIIRRHAAPTSSKAPFSFSCLQTLFSRASRHAEFCAAVLAAAQFTIVGRAGTAVAVAPGHVSFPEPREDAVAPGVPVVQVHLTRAKGHAHHISEWRVMEALPHPIPLPTPLYCPPGSLPGVVFCPVALWGLVKQLDTCSQFGGCTEQYAAALASLLRRCDGLLPKPASAYATHSARSGAACALLAAGLPVVVLKTLGLWKSSTDDILSRYTALWSNNSAVVYPLAFHNPRGMFRLYHATAPGLVGYPPPGSVEADAPVVAPPPARPVSGGAPPATGRSAPGVTAARPLTPPRGETAGQRTIGPPLYRLQKSRTGMPQPLMDPPGATHTHVWCPPSNTQVVRQRPHTCAVCGQSGQGRASLCMVRPCPDRCCLPCLTKWMQEPPPDLSGLRPTRGDDGHVHAWPDQQEWAGHGRDFTCALCGRPATRTKRFYLCSVDGCDAKLCIACR
eukprot:TRINITY_DN983_c0_g1_i25.p1 TRINITY_DN983_c0_g1~~TRINITY_DN983_c0_g1_i25.p1  ORF type:complete len:717 (+),score=15.37 TRINITY_DN983_c0_g1_i25:57-2153(+)